MQGFFQFVQVASFFLFILLAILSFINLSAINRNRRQIRRLRQHYHSLFQGDDNLDMEGLLQLHQEQIEENREEIKKLIVDTAQAKENLRKSVQKIGYIRYDAFDDLQNKLSFSMALLNQDLDGVIMTSIYGREQSTVFTKEIRLGRTGEKLSEFEKEALDQALNQ